MLEVKEHAAGDRALISRRQDEMEVIQEPDMLLDHVSDILSGFTQWLQDFGETSWDYQSFFAGPLGGRAKALYYRHRLIGTAAVAPMIFCEAFLPSGTTAVSSSAFGFRLPTPITRWALLSFTRQPEIPRNWKTQFIF